MSEQPHGDVTRLLAAWSAGSEDALAALAEAIGGELRGLAAREMRRERRDHTLQPTALVNEAYLRLLAHGGSWRDRAHFLAVAGGVMRRVLVDHARRRAAAKRPRAALRVTLGDALPAGPPPLDVAVLDLDAALDRLAALDARAARVVELHGLAGCSVQETAEVLGVSVPTVVRDWRMARTWLRRELAREEPSGAGDPASP